MKALEYESAQEQDDYMDSHPVLPRALSRKPSSVVPLASIRTNSEHSIAVPEDGKAYLQPIKTPVHAPARTEVKKEEPSVLPDCVAD